MYFFLNKIIYFFADTKISEMLRRNTTKSPSFEAKEFNLSKSGHSLLYATKVFIAKLIRQLGSKEKEVICTES